MPSSKRKPTVTSYRVSRGQKYERAAAVLLETLGFEILNRNWRSGHKEIDLIVRRGNLIVFVEVKSAHSRRFGHPAEWVGARKRKNLIEAAEMFVEKNDVRNCDLRFDVVAFVDGKPEHYPNAFGVE